MLGLHQSSIYFCMNPFYKFHHLELHNLIHVYFKTFLKIMQVMKNAC